MALSDFRAYHGQETLQSGLEILIPYSTKNKAFFSALSESSLDLLCLVNIGQY